MVRRPAPTVLYVPVVSSGSSPSAVTAWRPAVPGVREVFHARFGDHAYPRHTHATWTVLIVDAGTIRFDLDGRAHGSAAGHVTVLPPHITHDGRAASTRGFVKRVLYLDATHLPDDLVGPAVDAPTFADGRLRADLARVHDGLATGAEPLAVEQVLALATERLTVRLRGRRGAPPAPPAAEDLAEATRALLDAGACDGVTLADLSARLDTSGARIARVFSATFAIPPHAYVLGRRIDRARGLLLDGRPPGEVAVAVGFHDQAHFTRHFVRHVGTTPGRFAKAGGSPQTGDTRRAVS